MTGKKESGITIPWTVKLCKDLSNLLKNYLVKALDELGMDITIDHVRDYEKIAAYGVMTTPALVVDGKVVSYGKVLKKKKWLSY